MYTIKQFNLTPVMLTKMVLTGLYVLSFTTKLANLTFFMAKWPHASLKLPIRNLDNVILNKPRLKEFPLPSL